MPLARTHSANIFLPGTTATKVYLKLLRLSLLLASYFSERPLPPALRPEMLTRLAQEFRPRKYSSCTSQQFPRGEP